MIQAINTPISVTTRYNHHLRQTRPVTVSWEGRDYHLIKIGLHHTFREGRTLYHVFSAASQACFFKLILNTDTLTWHLSEIADAEAG